MDSTSTLNGLFKSIYEKKAIELMPSMFDINKATYSLWNQNQPQDYTLVVHPVTYKRLMEDTMGGCDNVCEGTTALQDSPLLRELANRKYAVKELRATIARKQEELRIALALLAAVKKLKKGSK